MLTALRNLAPKVPLPQLDRLYSWSRLAGGVEDLTTAKGLPDWLCSVGQYSRFKHCNVCTDAGREPGVLREALRLNPWRSESFPFTDKRN